MNFPQNMNKICADCEFINVKKVSHCTTFDKDCVHEVLSLLEQYLSENSKEKSPEEFVKEFVCSQKLFVETQKELIVYFFLKICYFYKFISSVLDEVRTPVNNKTIGKVFGETRTEK